MRRSSGGAKMFRDIPRWVIAVTLAILAGTAIWAFVVLPRRLREAFENASVKVTYYFLTGCPWCKKFAPEWAAFKDAATKEKLMVVTEDVDAEKDGDKVPKDIKGFPTIRITDAKGETTTYEGDRTSAALLAAVKKAGAAAVTEAPAAEPEAAKPAVA